MLGLIPTKVSQVTFFLYLHLVGFHSSLLWISYKGSALPSASLARVLKYPLQSVHDARSVDQDKSTLIQLNLG